MDTLPHTLTAHLGDVLFYREFVWIRFGAPNAFLRHLYLSDASIDAGVVGGGGVVTNEPLRNR